MKRYNGFLIVGIDHGYGNIKTAAVVPYLKDMIGLNMLADIGNGTVHSFPEQIIRHAVWHTP